MQHLMPLGLGSPVKPTHLPPPALAWGPQSHLGLGRQFRPIYLPFLALALARPSCGPHPNLCLGSPVKPTHLPPPALARVPHLHLHLLHLLAQITQVDSKHPCIWCLGFTLNSFSPYAAHDMVLPAGKATCKGIVMLFWKAITSCHRVSAACLLAMSAVTSMVKFECSA